MGQPITWRNVNGPNPALAAIPLRDAQQSGNAAFAQFGQLIKDRETFNANQIAKGEEAAKQGYLDSLQGAATPEQLVAMESQLKGQYAALPTAARAATRAAFEARLASLRQGVTAGNTYNDQEITRTETPVISQINAMIQAGDLEGAKAATDAADIRNKATLYSTIHDMTRRGKTEAQADKLATLTLETAQRTNKLGQLNLSEAEQRAADAKETRNLQTVLAAERTRVQTESQEALKKQGDLAKLNGWPVTANGYPDYDNMSPEERASFNGVAPEAGVPSLDVTFKGDTLRGDDIFQRIRDSGKFSDKVLLANEQSIRAAGSTLASPKVGRDADTDAWTRAKTQAAFESEDATNWYPPNSKESAKVYESVAAQIPNLVKSLSNGYDREEDVEDIQALLGKVTSVGVLRKKDQKMVVPSANDFLRFVRSSGGTFMGLFRDASRAEGIEEELTKWVNSKEGMEAAEKNEKSASYRLNKRAEDILREAQNLPKK